MLSINEILRTECFNSAKLLTDADLNATVIGAVTVGEVPDIAQWLTGGEMVLTTLFSARGDGDEKFETVENIIKSPAGALVVKLGRFIESLPPHIIELANERHFPMISLPSEVRWTNVIADIYRLLSQRELAKLTWLESVRQQFGRITSDDGGLKPIAKTLSGLIGCSVVIEDLLGGVLANSREERVQGDNSTIIEENPIGEYTPIFEQLGNKSNSYRIEQNVSPNSYLYYVVSDRKKHGLKKYAFELDDGHDHCGYLVVIVDESEIVSSIDERQILAIEKAVEAANIEMSKTRASIDAEMRLMGNLFSLLNSGNLTHQQAASRASFLQIDLSTGYIVCVVDLIHAVEDTSPRTIGQIMERAFSLVKRMVSSYFPGSLVALDDRRVNVLIVPNGGIDPSQRRGLVESMVEKIVQGLRDAVTMATFRIGVSQFHGDASEVNIAHNEAITAALIAVATGREDKAGSFRDLGLYKLLLHINRSHPDETRKFYLDTLGTIEEYDQKRESDLLHTMEVFFASGENINDTAAKLFTHRHTVRYRLQRIAEVSGLDPFNPDDGEMLRVALKLKQLLAIG